MFKFFNKLRYFDIPLFAASLLLALAGLALVYSTSLSSDTIGIFWKQTLFFGLGILGFFFFSFFDYHTLARANKIIYLITILLLVYLLFFGPDIRGGRRWLPLGFFYLQVAEFVKLVVILGLARLLYLKRGQINSWKNIIWSLVYTSIPAGLIILEPDLGSAIIIIGIWAGILLISPIEKKILAILFIIFLVASGTAWKFFLKDFQRDRIKVFLNPALDPKGRGYNVKQAAIAVGGGQLLGRGLGKGLQSQNKFLPERQTDFIFAASAEEIGFFGSAALLGLYAFLFVRMLVILRKAKDDLGMYITGGVFFWIFFHTLINVGMNIGLLPVTGLPLPFISAGGSSLIMSLAALGVVQNIAIQSKILRF